MSEKTQLLVAGAVVFAVITAWGLFNASGKGENLEILLPLVAGVVGVWLWKPWKRKPKP